MSNLLNRTSISYSRFSSDQQKLGDSLKRQLETYQSIVKQHSLIDIGQAFIDEGKSAYKGKHLDAQLGAMIQVLVTMNLPQKPVLVIEKWDRLSRLEMNATIDLFRRVVAVADILDASDGALYTSSTMNDITGYITLGLKAHQAHIFSKNISERVRAAKKRQSLESGDSIIKGRNYPKWLSLIDNAFVEVPDRVTTIKKIFELKLKGMGIRSITAYLNDNGYKPWDNKGEVSKEWLTGTVRNHLKNIAVTGAFRNKDVFTADYYPRLVSNSDFNEVQSSFTTQVQSPWNANKRNGDNILYNVRCMYCDSSMTFAKRDVSILACSRGRACKNSSLAYGLVEEVVCDVLFETADLSESTVEVVHVDNRAELEEELLMLKERIQSNTEQNKRTSAMILLRVDELEQEIESLSYTPITVIQKPAEYYWQILHRSVEDRLRLGRYIQQHVQKVEVLSVSRKRKVLVVVINGKRYPVEVKVKPKVGYEYWTLKGVDDGVALIG